MRKRAVNSEWDRVAGAAVRARETLRKIIVKTVADQERESTLREIRELAADGLTEIRMALKHPAGGA